jgi:hypothetical protein
LQEWTFSQYTTAVAPGAFSTGSCGVAQFPVLPIAYSARVTVVDEYTGSTVDLLETLDQGAGIYTQNRTGVPTIDFADSHRILRYARDGSSCVRINGTFSSLPSDRAPTFAQLSQCACARVFVAHSLPPPSSRADGGYRVQLKTQLRCLRAP